MGTNPTPLSKIIFVYFFGAWLLATMFFLSGLMCGVGYADWIQRGGGDVRKSLKILERQLIG